MSQKKHCKPYNFFRRGMTLIELLIVVVVIGVISAFAYPAYQEYVLKSHRSTALSDIMRMQIALEQSYDTTTGSYDLSVVYASSACTICETDTTRYTITAENDPSGYILKAKALGTLGQTKDVCFGVSEDTISITAANVRAPASCWK